MDKYEKKSRSLVTTLQKELKAIYDEVADEVGIVGQTNSGYVDKERAFRLSDYPTIKKKVDALVKRLSEKVGVVIVNGVRSQWTLANNKNNELCNIVFGNFVASLTEAQMRRYYNNNDTALEAFLARKIAGLNLSDRVWNYSKQFRGEIESTLELGIKTGQSAAEIARDLKDYLVYPDKLFRRVRDEKGNLHLSEPAKRFHPGVGVDRSSYKNALRLAATENNMAYRTADNERIQQLDFVVGIEIHLSNNHTLNGEPFYDICDELAGRYPKEFKFVGWHPLCYDKESEVLTNRGWLHFSDVRADDLVFSLNPTNRITEWSAISKQMQWKHTGKMVHFYNRSLDCLVTPDHPMIYISKSGGDIRKVPASEYRKGLGAIYRSSDYDNKDIDRIDIGKLSLPFDAFCEFMGYWLSDGSACRSGQVSIAQQDTSPVKDKIVDCISSMGLQPHRGVDNITIYDTNLCNYLKQFGKCADKYIPKEIKESSRRQIRIFLDAFVSCDGHIKKPRVFIGNRGSVCYPQGERMYFTTSAQMAADLGELIVKAGKRPSYRVNECAGKIVHFRNGDYTINHNCYVVSECNSATASVFDKEWVEYDDMVYDLELSRNHIMYIRRNGKCFWGSNCRCFVTTILKTPEEVKRDLDGVDRGSINEVKKLPPQFRAWLRNNADRIAISNDRGMLPYFLRDNRWAWRDLSVAEVLKHLQNKESLTPTEIDYVLKHNPKMITEDIFSDNGKWSAQRERLHKEIIARYIGSGSVKSDTVYMLGGAPANGKSTVVGSGMIDYPDGILTLDVDAVKKLIPEYGTAQKSAVEFVREDAANFVHEESSYLGKRIQSEVFSKEQSLVIDGVNDGSFEKVAKKVAAIRQQTGLRVRADYVTCDTAESLRRNEERYAKTGRRVDANIITHDNKAISEIVPQLIKNNTFDELYLWDTNSPEGAKAVLSLIDGKLTIFDAELYQRFLDKAR